MLDFNRRTERGIFKYRDGCRMALGRQGNLTIRLSVHILIADVTGILIDPEVTVNGAAELVEQAE
ncbi:hypothetical protein D3C81_1908780 [compost metagenome]